MVKINGDWVLVYIDVFDEGYYVYVWNEGMFDEFKESNF